MRGESKSFFFLEILILMSVFFCVSTCFSGVSVKRFLSVSFSFFIFYACLVFFGVSVHFCLFDCLPFYIFWFFCVSPRLCLIFLIVNKCLFECLSVSVRLTACLSISFLFVYLPVYRDIFGCLLLSILSTGLFVFVCLSISTHLIVYLDLYLGISYLSVCWFFIGYSFVYGKTFVSVLLYCCLPRHQSLSKFLSMFYLISRPGLSTFLHLSICFFVFSALLCLPLSVCLCLIFVLQCSEILFPKID